MLEIIITNIIWAPLFVGLLIYQLKDSAKREKKYQEVIEKLSKQEVNDTKHVRKEVCERLVEMLTDKAELIQTGSIAEFMFTVYDLQESVKEIQGEIHESS